MTIQISYFPSGSPLIREKMLFRLPGENFVCLILNESDFQLKIVIVSHFGFVKKVNFFFMYFMRNLLIKYSVLRVNLYYIMEIKVAFNYF